MPHNRKWSTSRGGLVTIRDFCTLRSKGYTREQTLGILAEISDRRWKVNPVREYKGGIIPIPEAQLYY